MTTFVRWQYMLFFACILFLGSCGPPHITPKKEERKRPGPATQRPYIIKGRTYYPIPSAQGYRETGVASWYGKIFHGRKTSNGETYNMYAATAAHKTLPMGTMLLVKNVTNGRSTVVRINDRGPFVKNRIIDLSYKAAKDIQMIQNGTAKVVLIAMGESINQQRKPTTSAPVRFKHQDFKNGQFYIQVGSFEQRRNARRLAKKFAALGRDVVIQQFPAAGIHLFRVQVFASTSLAKARQYESYLEKHGFPNALIVAR